MIWMNSNKRDTAKMKTNRFPQSFPLGEVEEPSKKQYYIGVATGMFIGLFAGTIAGMFIVLYDQEKSK